MKAVLFNRADRVWRATETPAPSRKNGYTLVRITHAGLCGSDVHRIHSPLPAYEIFPLGHEISGFVEETESDTTPPGTLVVVNPIIPCMACAFCRRGKTQFCTASYSLGKNKPGGFAELVSVPLQAVYRFGCKMPRLGVLVDSVAVVLHAMRLRKSMESPQKVLVLGDGSLAGVSLAVLRAQFPFAQLFFTSKNEPNARVLSQTYKAIVLPEKTKDSLEADLVMETVGRAQHNTLEQAVFHAGIGADVLVMGVFLEGYKMALALRSAFYKELSIQGVNSFETPIEGRNDFRDAICLLEAREDLFAPLITHEMPLEKFEDVLQLLGRRTEMAVIKIVLKPSI